MVHFNFFSFHQSIDFVIMNLHVISEFRLQTKSLGTSSLKAFIGVLADVQTLVLVEVSVLSKRLLAEILQKNINSLNDKNNFQ